MSNVVEKRDTLFIGGEFIAPASSQTIEVISPFTEEIVGIAVNRWPHGYAYTYDTLADPDVPPEKRPHVVGRQRHGWIAIANSDAGAGAFTNQAFDEAHRAVQELLIARGLS